MNIGYIGFWGLSVFTGQMKYLRKYKLIILSTELDFTMKSWNQISESYVDKKLVENTFILELNDKIMLIRSSKQTFCHINES